MKIRTFLYSLKQGIINIWRNKMFSFASVITMTACIFLLGLFFSIIYNFQYNIKEAEKEVPVTVYFKEEATEDEKNELKDNIDKREEVESIKYISAEEAWDTFKNDYFSENPSLADSFADDNPLANSDHFEIFLGRIEDQTKIVNWLSQQNIVRDVKVSQVAANMLSNFNLLIGYVSIAIIVILLVVAIFLISNTVATGISIRKEEIAIMKYIGATDYFVRAPFVVEGIMIGFIGAVVPLVLLYFLYQKAISYIIARFHVLSGIISFLPVETVFKYLVPVGLALGIGIGLIGSHITTHKHLKV